MGSRRTRGDRGKHSFKKGEKEIKQVLTLDDYYNFDYNRELEEHEKI